MGDVGQQRQYLLLRLGITKLVQVSFEFPSTVLPPNGQTILQNLHDTWLSLSVLY